jgi:hypothetical protein
MIEKVGTTNQPNLYDLLIFPSEPFFSFWWWIGHHVNILEWIVSTAIGFVEVSKVPSIEHVTFLEGIRDMRAGKLFEATNTVHESNQTFMRRSTT